MTSAAIKSELTMAVINYAQALHQEIEQTPQEYLGALLNIVHTFKESVTEKPVLDEATRLALAEGQRQADNGQFASDDEVTNFFKKWDVDA